MEINIKNYNLNHMTKTIDVYMHEHDSVEMSISLTLHPLLINYAKFSNLISLAVLKFVTTDNSITLSLQLCCYSPKPVIIIFPILISFLVK